MKKVIIALSITTIAAKFAFATDSAKMLIEKNGCMSCHNIMGMKKAPPFAGISWRNSRASESAKGILKNSIKNGSQGKYAMFSQTKMPAFSHLNDQELDTLANWVLSQSQNMMCDSGKCGSAMNTKNQRSEGWW